MSTNGESAEDLLSLIDADTRMDPHRFEAYLYSCNTEEHWEYVGQACLRAWRLDVDALLEDAEETGFGDGPCRQILNDYGAGQLPPTPPADNEVAKDPAITDITEVAALHTLAVLKDDIEFPYPRTLHQEPGTQHHGIDLIGYRLVDGEIILYVVEVMASAEDGSPPSTVYDHKSQLKDRLDDAERDELIRDLRTVYVEADETHRLVLGDVITRLIEEREDLEPEDIIATPVLVRRNGELEQSDWSPFRNSADEFENFLFPSVVFFIGLELEGTYIEFLDDVKERLQTDGVEGAMDAV